MERVEEVGIGAMVFPPAKISGISIFVGVFSTHVTLSGTDGPWTDGVESGALSTPVRSISTSTGTALDEVTAMPGILTGTGCFRMVFVKTDGIILLSFDLILIFVFFVGSFSFSFSFVGVFVTISLDDFNFLGLVIPGSSEGGNEYTPSASVLKRKSLPTKFNSKSPLTLTFILSVVLLAFLTVAVLISNSFPT